MGIIIYGALLAGESLDWQTQSNGESQTDVWSTKVSASGTSEEEAIDPTYVIIGVTLGALLTIGFLALKICMIKRQLRDSDLVDSERRVDRRSPVGSAEMREEARLQEQQSTKNL
ncbi:transmembrane protein 273 [Emydura macquarii macquarii]|uniref:transmembrane protein 273 n=1 Tax=Emydura macquarii macquarii TaxID=1129001 RepID=UPI00352BC5AB